MSKMWFLILFVFAFVGCEEGSNKDSESDALPPSNVESPDPDGGSVASPISEKSRFAFHEDLEMCLNDQNDPGFNDNPVGENYECVDLSNRDLTSQDFRNKNLRGANLQNSILRKILLKGSKLKGIKIDGVEVDSEKILQWLILGYEPKDPTPVEPVIEDESNNDSSEESEDLEDESTIIAEEEASNQEEIAQESLDDRAGVALQEFQSVEEMIEHFNDLKMTAGTELLYSNFKTATERLHRRLHQSRSRIHNKKVKTLRQQIRSLKIEGNSDGAEQAQQELLATQALTEGLQEKSKALKESLSESSKTARAQREIQRYAAKVERFSKQLLKLGHVVDPDTDFEKDYPKIIDELSLNKESLQSEINDLKKQVSVDKEEMARVNLLAAPYRSENKTLSQQIRDLNTEIKALSAKIKESSDSAEQQSLTLEREQKLKQRSSIRDERKVVQNEIKRLNAELSEPRNNLKQLSSKLRELNQGKKQISNELRQAQILNRLIQLAP